MAKRLLNRTVFYVVMFFVWLAYSFRFLARYCTQHFEGVSRKSNSRAPVFYRRSPWEWTTRRSDTKRLCQLHGGWLPHLWKLWVINSLAGMPVFRVLLRFFSILLKKFCPLCFFLSDWRKKGLFQNMPNIVFGYGHETFVVSGVTCIIALTILRG